ncbi:MAG: hypothetical protein K2X29_02850 [Candidatus Obscuribacterales bacterium]|nr:hypothetical protein [Candidatus Obscuribacterales bacterium]
MKNTEIQLSLVLPIVAAFLALLPPASIADPMLINGRPARKEKQPSGKEPTLKGTVQETDFIKNFRLQRPEEKKPLSTGITTEADKSKSLTPLDPHASILSPIPAEVKTETLLPKVDLREPTKKSDEGGKSSTATDEQKPPPKQKRVVIRIRRVVALMEAEIAESALKTALSMLKQEPESNVTVFLDLDAVSLADGEFTWHDQFSGDENGNLRVISIKHLRSLLTKFGADGGRIIVAERWAKVRGFQHKTNTMVPHSELLDDDAIAKVLLESTNVVDY